MNFSIIIINYKTPELTAQCLRGLLALPKPENREIIIIDNASGDDSVAKLKTEFQDKIQIISNRINLGFAGANNQGAALAQGELLLFLNSDTIIKDDILSSCEAIFKGDNKIGIVSPRLMLENGEPQKMAYNHFPTLWKLITRKSKQEIRVPSEAKILEVDWVSGCALVIKKDLFNKLGGWDDNFFLYFEDVDLCKRTKELGYKVVVNLKTSLIHLGGKSLAKQSERKKYYYEAQDYYFEKNKKYLSQMIIKFYKDIINLFYNV